MKARLPKGMGGGPGNMNSMIRQAQKMQEEMEAAGPVESEFKAAAGGGAVEVVMNGKREVLSVTIKPEVVDPEDVEMLQDLLIAATNEVLRTIETTTSQRMEKVTGGLNVPGMF